VTAEETNEIDTPVEESQVEATPVVEEIPVEESPVVE